MSESDTAPVRKVLAIVDPNRLVQTVLEKAEWVAKRNGAQLHLYCCIYDSQLAFDHSAKRAALDNTRDWLERISDRSRAQGIEVTREVEWHAQWRDRILVAAERSGADLLVKASSKHTRLARHLMKTSDWALLRNSSQPMLLVNPNQTTDHRVVLAAVKLKPSSEAYFTLNERVVAMAHRLAGVLGAELHAVTSYEGEEIYFDRQRFADGCRLPRNRVYAVEGPPSRAIAEVAAEIGAGVLIIGSAKSDSSGGLAASTDQCVIDEVDTDVVVVPGGRRAAQEGGTGVWKSAGLSTSRSQGM